VAFAFLAAAHRLRLAPTIILAMCVVVAASALAARFVGAAAGIGIAAVAVIPIYWARVTPPLPIVPTAAVVVTLVLLPAAAACLPWVRATAIDVAFALYCLFLATSTLVVMGGKPTAAGLALLTSVVLPYAVFRCLALSVRVRRAVAWGMVGSALLLSGVGIAERLTDTNPFFTLVKPRYLAAIWAIPEHRFGSTRAEASFGHPIAFGMFLAVVTVLVLSLAREGRHHALGLAATGLIVTGLLATLSRGPIVAAGVGGLLWFVSRRRQLTPRDVVVVLLMAAGLFAVPAARETVTGLASSSFGNTSEASSADYRLTLLDVAREPSQFSMLGHTPTRLGGQPDRTDRAGNKVGSVDSEYIRLYLNNGLLTLLPFAVLALLLLAALARGDLSALDSAWLAGAVAIMIGSLTVALITQFQAMAYMVLGVAAAAAQRSDATDGPREVPTSPAGLATRRRSSAS
jgi:hypothetical protein